MQRILSGPALLSVTADLRLKDIDVALRRGRRGPHQRTDRGCAASWSFSAARRARPRTSPRQRSPTKPARVRTGDDPGVVVKGVDDVWVKLARCCTPVPGDAIVGFVTRARGVSVHRSNCVNVTDAGREPVRRRRVGADGVQRLPGLDPGRGARPGPAALRRHPGAVRPARQHPQRLGDHDARPGGDVAVHLRDGRHPAPGPRAGRRAGHRGRLRRLPLTNA